MEYNSFEQIELPNLLVCEPNPIHDLDFRRYSSDQVSEFNRVQFDILKAKRPDLPVIHNFMSRYTDFDHFELGKTLDIASWDSYPIGHLAVSDEPEETKRQFLRQGDPDNSGFHHDLYRAVGHGRWWVMEQQPGPVNWAQHNPDPLPGMARLWAWEAFAHGAEVVSYFRWRQAPSPRNRCMPVCCARQPACAGLPRSQPGWPGTHRNRPCRPGWQSPRGPRL